LIHLSTGLKLKIGKSKYEDEMLLFMYIVQCGCMCVGLLIDYLENQHIFRLSVNIIWKKVKYVCMHDNCELH